MDAEPAQFSQAILTPSSGGTIYASPAPSYHQHRRRRRSTVKHEHNDDDDDDDDDGDADADDSIVANGTAGYGAARDPAGVSMSIDPLKRKQKRNKPTLSCFECVERKTKVSDLLRPPEVLSWLPCYRRACGCVVVVVVLPRLLRLLISLLLLKRGR